MGQGQSTADDDGGQQVKADYYDLLGVERTATEEEIKKAYRRKALELHPDRNYGNVEDATRLFAEIQSAYEILSDPQERAWYDSHRDVLLRGDQGGAADGQEFSYNIRMTTADEVLKLMLKFHGRLDYSDSPSGFYGGLREFFQKLAKEEDVACQWEDQEPLDYPDFGHQDDSYDDVVRPFYAVWGGFATRKSYAWKDEYRLADAPDRKIRRLMEKENKKIREEAVREYNDAVRSLITFVRKRDPRFQENQKTEAERQKMLRDLTAANAARARAARQARLDELDKLAVPDWAQSRALEEHEGAFSSESEAEDHEYECVVCDKIFKSEAQFHTHEKSKKHLKLVKQLKREMRAEDVHLGETDEQPPATEVNGSEVQADGPAKEPKAARNTETPATHPEPLSPESNHDGDEEKASIPNGHRSAGQPDPASVSRGSSDPENEEDDDYAPRSAVLNRLAASLASTSLEHTPATSDTDQPKLGKAKQKRAKKAAQKAAASAGPKDDDAEFRCAVCQAGFPSRTRLFTHIEEQAHAAPAAQVKGKSRTGKKR